MKKNIRAGMTFYKGKEICQVTKIFKIKSGQECYCSSTYLNESNVWKCLIWVFDLEKFVEKDFKEVESYLTF